MFISRTFIVSGNSSSGNNTQGLVKENDFLSEIGKLFNKCCKRWISVKKLMFGPLNIDALRRICSFCYCVNVSLKRITTGSCNHWRWCVVWKSWQYHDMGTFSTSLAHYDDVIMSTIASQITSLAIVYSTIYSRADQSKLQSSASLAFVWGIHRGPVNSPQKWPVTRKMFPFDDVIMFRRFHRLSAGGFSPQKLRSSFDVLFFCL